MKKISEFIATGFYVGYIRVAPGTFGSFSAVVSVWWMQQFFDYSVLVKIVCIVLTTIIGLFSADHLLKDTREKDPQYIVIDEWAGQFTAFLLVPASLENLALGFIFFRIFDILKIFPVKNAERLRGAWGVMADDLLAGIYAAVCLYLWHRFI
jgi:phosphatidylglycerophosphatase A